jgi:hypothetical protein
MSALGSLADIRAVNCDVRLSPKSGHVLPSVNSTGVYLTKCPALFVVKPQMLMQRGTF